MKKDIKHYMPIATIWRLICRYRLKNKDFTLLTHNCFGGIIYNCLGLQFKSPTVNVRFNTVRDFYKFCSNLDYYLSLPLEEYKYNNEGTEMVAEGDYPLGTVGDVKIHLVHYKTFEEAKSKWESRVKRVNRDNLFIIANDWLSETERITDEEIKAFTDIPCKGVCVLTQVETNIPNAYNIGKENLGNLMATNKFTGLRGFETFFDYVSFLNGKDYKQKR